jgi:uncharacterized protein YjbJ (UPF0337 family)
VNHRVSEKIQGAAMKRDRTEGDWKQFEGKVRRQWSELTDDDIELLEGTRAELAGRVQKRRDAGWADFDARLKTIH